RTRRSRARSRSGGRLGPAHSKSDNYEHGKTNRRQLPRLPARLARPLRHQLLPLSVNRVASGRNIVAHAFAAPTVTYNFVTRHGLSGPSFDRLGPSRVETKHVQTGIGRSSKVSDPGATNPAPVQGRPNSPA